MQYDGYKEQINRFGTSGAKKRRQQQTLTARFLRNNSGCLIIGDDFRVGAAITRQLSQMILYAYNHALTETEENMELITYSGAITGGQRG